MGSEESGASAGSNPGAGDAAPRGALCRVEDIPDGGAIGAHVSSSTGGFDLILMRLGDRVFAYHNECPHAGRNLDYAPGQFLVKDARIVCAVHGATFAVDSGACLGGPCRSGLVAMPVEVIDGEVRVR
ncbi:MAG TPA: Rieske (2Fe-2S) protein [Rhodanobacteraceae bacterium]|nr:Rieske (2Fe-2S) protein [Rhodanobacteraceae bacterium]